MVRASTVAAWLAVALLFGASCTDGERAGDDAGVAVGDAGVDAEAAGDRVEGAPALPDLGASSPDAPVPAGGGPWFEHAGDGAFRGHSGVQAQAPFDVVAADMDLDGDTDLVINWHDLAPLELFENRGGSFELVSREASGLHAGRGVGELYAPFATMVERIRARGEAGLYLWHDERRGAAWHFLWIDDLDSFGGLLVDLETSIGFSEPRGLRELEVSFPDPRLVDIGIEPSSAERQFHIRTQGIGIELTVRVGKSRSGNTPPLFVGAGMKRWSGAELQLWKADPHGMAWVDVEGSARPDLYLARGALAGMLAAPAAPKTDRYYTGTSDQDDVRYRLGGPGDVPPDYGRGRGVEWVDIDNDGSLELSVGNRDSPNRLLARDRSTGAFRDRADELGIDFTDGEVHTWADLDGDGFQDLFYVAESGLNVALNLAGRGFERVAGNDLGLELPAGGKTPGRFDTAALRFADFDGDGDLDLWVLGYGAQRSSLLFRKDRNRFSDISKQVGLTGKRGQTLVVLLDVDSDGFEDAVSFGRDVLLWKNEGGERFSFHALDADLVPETIHAAAALDADGDGRTDLVAVGRHRHLLRNVAAGGSFIDVVPRDGDREPIGAVVRAIRADGRGTARRYGSVDNTSFSQALQPLRFGAAPGKSIARVGVRWPGATDEKSYRIGAAGRLYTVER